MKKFWQMVSKRDIIFLLIIFAAVIIFSIHQSSNKVKVFFGEEVLAINSPYISMNIPYADVNNIALVEMTDPGEVIDGKDNSSLRAGVWKNDSLGEYTLCMDPDATNCIVVKLNDGRIFVFNRKDNAETSNLFEIFKTYLPSAPPSDDVA